jgi:hypothetical protein
MSVQEGGRVSGTLDSVFGTERLPLGRVELVEAETDFETRAVRQIIVRHHSYVPTTAYVGRKIDYLVKNEGEIVGTIGVGSAILSMGPRERFIGWDRESRMKNLNMVCNNYRFTLMPSAPKFSGSVVLGKLEERVVGDWMKHYGDKLVLIETLVKPPRDGTIYKAANWTYVGETRGVQFKWILKTELGEWKTKGWKKAQDGSSEGFLDKTKISMPNGTSKKLIFVKPLNRAWQKYLQGKIPVTRREVQVAVPT